MSLPPHNGRKGKADSNAFPLSSFCPAVLWCRWRVTSKLGGYYRNHPRVFVWFWYTKKKPNRKSFPRDGVCVCELCTVGWMWIWWGLVAATNPSIMFFPFARKCLFYSNKHFVLLLSFFSTIASGSDRDEGGKTMGEIETLQQHQVPGPWEPPRAGRRWWSK